MATFAEMRGVAASVRVYEALLVVYPEAFREGYGREMVLAFRDRCREVIAEEGAWGLITFWVPVLLDLVKTSIEEHAHKESSGMLKNVLVRATGSLLLLAGMLFVLGTSWSRTPRWAVGEFGLFTAFVPLALGLLGLALGPARHVEAPGRVGLGGAILGAFSSTLSAGVMLVGSAASVSMPAWLENIWVLWWIGGLLVYVGMAVFGVYALRNRPLPRWNGLPLALGLSPLIVVAASELLALPWTDDTAMGSALAIMGVGWLLMGLVLMPRNARETAVA